MVLFFARERALVVPVVQVRAPAVVANREGVRVRSPKRGFLRAARVWGLGAGEKEKQSATHAGRSCWLHVVTGYQVGCFRLVVRGNVLGAAE